MTALTALAVAGETRRVPLMTCETVETETPASRATSAIVDTSPPAFLAVARLASAALLPLTLTHRNVCATVSTRPGGALIRDASLWRRQCLGGSHPRCLNNGRSRTPGASDRGH